MRRNSHFTLAIAGFAVAVLLAVAGGLLLWGSTYVHNTVHNQLAAQQIYFPPQAAFAHAKAGTEITPNMIPSVSQYAGQQMLTGQQAEAYADHFIAQHITDMSGGKTYSQLSAESIAQPNNAKLAGLVATVFKGETLRSMLLNAYGWWKVSQITYIASLAAFGLGRPDRPRLAGRPDPGPQARDHPRSDHRPPEIPSRPHDPSPPNQTDNTTTGNHLRPAPPPGAGPEDRVAHLNHQEGRGRCSRYGSTGAAARAWSRRPNCWPRPRSAKAGTRRRSRASARSGWARR